jgi:hypothetical protein
VRDIGTVNNRGGGDARGALTIHYLSNPQYLNNSDQAIYTRTYDSRMK